MKTSIQNRANEAASQPATSMSGPQVQPHVANSRQSSVERQLNRVSQLGHRFDAVDVLPTLTLGPTGDQYEREADRAAQQVAEQITDPPAATGGPAPRLTPLPRHAQGAPADGAGAVQRHAAGGHQGISPVPGGVAAQIDAARPDGQSLPTQVRAPMEQALGFRFGDVRIHAGRRAQQLNQALDARAFAVGSDIFFSHPAPLPPMRGAAQSDDAFDKLDLLGEELAHVVQQSTGGVQRVQRQDGRRRRRRRRDETGSQRRWRRLHSGQTDDQPQALPRPASPAAQDLPAARINPPPSRRPLMPPLDLSRLNRPAPPAPARLQQPPAGRPARAAAFADGMDSANAALDPVAGAGGSAITLADMGMSLPATSDSSWQGGGDAWSGGSTYSDYASADPSALAVATGPLGLIGLTSLPGNMRKQSEGIGDVIEGLSGPEKDYRRAIEGAGTVVETAASNYSSLLSATGATTNLAWAGAKLAGSGAAESAGQVLTATGQIAPGVGVVTGGIGTVKGIYQGLSAQARMGDLRRMAAANGQSATQQMLIQYALENQEKQRDRAVINTTSSALGTTGSALSLSGVGAGVGATFSASGAAVKYGAAARRAVKQSLRNRRAKRISRGQSGPLGKLTDKLFDPNVQKTSALKKLKLDLMTEALVGGGAEHADIFEAMGANKADLRLLRRPDRTQEEHQRLTQRAQELFKKRE